MDKEELRASIEKELNTFEEGLIDADEFMIRMGILAQKDKPNQNGG